MAKNTVYRPADPASQQEAIRKAKGNPNKNIHHKKKNANYGGGDALAKKEAAKQAQQQRGKQPPMPASAKITLGILLGVLVILLILNYTVLKNNQIIAHVSSLLIGALCCYMAYVNYCLRRLRGGFYTVLTVVLVLLGVIYVLVSLAALASLAG